MCEPQGGRLGCTRNQSREDRGKEPVDSCTDSCQDMKRQKDKQKTFCIFLHVLQREAQTKTHVLSDTSASASENLMSVLLMMGPLSSSASCGLLRPEAEATPREHAVKIEG